MMSQIVGFIPNSTNALIKIEIVCLTEFSLDKELTANCLVETGTELREPNLAAMVLNVN